jgi:ABC-type methionine transport system ATPase subunit
MNIIEFKNVSRRAPDSAGEERLILDNISFNVEEGEIFTIIGPSGSGKSSVIRLMNRLDEISSGEINFHGKPITDYTPQELRRKIAMTFQAPKLFGPKVLDDLCYPFEIDGECLSKSELKDRARYLADLIGLPRDFIDRDVVKLSGGEKMRVAIARALMRSPQVLLLDEPTSGLDPEAAQALLHTIRELNHAEGITIVVITHRFAYAKLIGKHTLLIDSGRVIETGPTMEFFNNPATEKARAFLKSDGS